MKKKTDLASIAEEDVRYFLSWGHDCCHDGDEWVGVYTSRDELKRAYKYALDNKDEDTSLRLMIVAFSYIDADKQDYQYLRIDEI